MITVKNEQDGEIDLNGNKQKPPGPLKLTVGWGVYPMESTFGGLIVHSMNFTFASIKTIDQE